MFIAPINYAFSPKSNNKTNFTSNPVNKIKDIDVNYERFSNLFNKTLEILKKADNDSKTFVSQGHKFSNISKPNVIISDVMQNKNGENFRLKFSQSHQSLSYGHYPPLRILTLDNDKPEIEIITELQNNYDNILSIKPYTYSKEEGYTFSNMSSKNLSSYVVNYSSKNAIDNLSLKEYVDTAINSFSVFINKFNSAK